MHDFSLIQNLCSQVEELARNHGAEKVVRIVLEMASTSHHSPEQISETFQLLRYTSPLLQETQVEFRKSESLGQEEIVVHDVELEIPE